MSEIIWADGLTMMGVPIGVKQEVSDDFRFQIETSKVVDMTNGATMAIVEATRRGDIEEVAKVKEFYDDLVESFKHGVEEGWFKPEDVLAFIEVVEEVKANPLSAVAE